MQRDENGVWWCEKTGLDGMPDGVYELHDGVWYWSVRRGDSASSRPAGPPFETEWTVEMLNEDVAIAEAG